MTHKKSYTARLRTRLTTAAHEGAADVIENHYACRVSQEGDTFVLRYADPDNHGTASIEVSARRTVVVRRGQVRSRMTYEAGMAHPADYRHPLGSIDMSIHTRHHAFCLTDNGGSLHIDCRVHIDGAPALANTLTIVWEREDA